MVLILDLWLRARLPEDVTVNAVVVFVVGVAFVAVVEVVGNTGAVAASAVVAGVALARRLRSAIVPEM